MESIPINEVIEDAESFAAERVSLKSIQLVQALDPMVKPVQADRSLLRYGFYSMIVNSVNHLRGRGIVTIITEGGADGAVDVTVSTIGTVEHSGKDRATTGAACGWNWNEGNTGLPLPVVRDIIAGQGGEMTWGSSEDGDLKFHVLFSGTCENGLGAPS